MPLRRLARTAGEAAAASHRWHRIASRYMDGMGWDMHTANRRSEGKKERHGAARGLQTGSRQEPYNPRYSTRLLQSQVNVIHVIFTLNDLLTCRVEVVLSWWRWQRDKKRQKTPNAGRYATNWPTSGIGWRQAIASASVDEGDRELSPS